MTQHTSMTRGRTGERVAARYLTSLGWIILDQNWRSSQRGVRGEVDIIATDPHTPHSTVFCEVKTRTTPSRGHGSEAITPKKYASLSALASSWLRENPRSRGPVRIDVISIHAGQGSHVTIHHHRAVTQP